jgi:hypothetical protein
MFRRFVATFVAVLCAFVPLGGARITFCIADACGVHESPPSCCAKTMPCCDAAAPVSPTTPQVSSTHSCECCITIELDDHAANRVELAQASLTPALAVAMPIEDPFAAAFDGAREPPSRAESGARESRPPPRYALRI